MQGYLFFVYFLATPRGIWDLSSSTMNLLPPAVEARSLNYWTAREAPIYRDIYQGIFLKQRKGYNLNPQIREWLRNKQKINILAYTLMYVILVIV